MSLRLATDNELLKIIDDSLQKGCPGINSYLNKFQDLERYQLNDIIQRKFYCIEVMNVVACILRELVNNFAIYKTPPRFQEYGKLTKGIKEWITGIKTLSAGANGITFMTGVNYSDGMVVIKLSKVCGSEELVHEFSIGIFLNNLRSITPCFMFTYGIFQCNDLGKGNVNNFCDKPDGAWFLMTEKIPPGKSFGYYITNGELTEDEFVSILLQILISLQIAYDKYKYNHNDLHVENILLRKMNEKINLSLIYGNQEYNFVTKYVPTIIDYGMSRIEYKGILFGNVEGFTTPNFQKFGINLKEQYPGGDIYKLLNSMGNKIKYSPNAAKYQNVFKTNFIDPLKGNISIFLNQTRLEVPNVDIEITVPQKGQSDKRMFYHALYEDKDPFGNIIREKFFKFEPKYIFTSPIFSKYYSKSPSLYYVNTLDCSGISYNSVLNEIFSPDGDLRFNCTENIGNWKNKAGGDEYWINCGNSYNDGIFDVVEVPQDTVFYHGSASLSIHNVEYPFGDEYYDKSLRLSQADEEILKNPNVDSATKEAIIRSAAPVAISFYSNYDVAKIYSEKDISYANQPILCGDNCVSAYRFIRNGIFVNLISPVNLRIILDPSYPISPSSKNIIMKNFGITDINNLSGFIVSGLTDNNYQAPKELLSNFISRGYAGFVVPKSSSSSRPDHSELVLGYNALDYIERDFNNEHDWQYINDDRLFSTFGELIKDMKRYKTTNIDFHAGDLYAHSIWTALWVQYWFKSNNIWASRIDPSLSPVVIISAFLHDIGKAGDLVYSYFEKPNHPKIGAEYILGRNNPSGRKYYYMNSSPVQQVLDINEILSDLFPNSSPQVINDIAKYISYFIISHWDFGKDFVSRVDTEDIRNIAAEYIEKMLGYIKAIDITNLNRNSFRNLILSGIMVSAADIKASQPYIDITKFTEVTNAILAAPQGAKVSDVIMDLNAYLDDYPILVNAPQSHRGGDKYSDFEIERKGLLLRDEVIRQIVQ